MELVRALTEGFIACTVRRARPRPSGRDVAYSRSARLQSWQLFRLIRYLVATIWSSSIGDEI